MTFVSNRADWPPPLEVFAVTDIEVVVEPGPHPFHRAEQAAAMENWEREVAANPALFDGGLVLQRDVRISGGRVETRAHVVPFSTFLLWRKDRPEGAFHLYGLPVIVSSDNAVIAIRMSAHTANAGKVYCAAGSLDASDVVDGRCDVEANMAREVREEIGFDLWSAGSTSGFFGVQTHGLIALFKFYRFDDTAEALAARIRAHMVTDPHREVDDVVIIRRPDPSLHRYSETMPPVLSWFFAHET
ncbi:NUDIX hydrolase [Pararhizobium sp.]|uniref:NUDIX hydrolase n=1 Tax=Pararhizobium sp. TaxID=1977563 RepID=UPI002728F186|nr:NUDIX hydrolase [Pararhizobium sp.]MDO9418746.1 NUDIX hydrolase [Pararhizobium sp.]